MINYIRDPLLTRKNTNTNMTHCHPFPFSRVGGVGPINNKKEKESAAVRAQSLYSQEENREPGREVRLSQPEGREDSGLTEPSQIREREKKYEKRKNLEASLCRATPRDTPRGRYPPTTKKKKREKRLWIFIYSLGSREGRRTRGSIMFGEKALELVGELKRARPATIPPYNEDLTRQVREHSPPTRACSSSSSNTH